VTFQHPQSGERGVLTGDSLKLIAEALEEYADRLQSREWADN
jgi:hypothetical protein